MRNYIIIAIVIVVVIVGYLYLAGAGNDAETVVEETAPASGETGEAATTTEGASE